MKIKLTLLLLLVPLLTWGQKSKEFNLDETFAINKTGTIHMDTDDAEIKIEGSSRDDVQVTIYRKIRYGGIRWGEQSEIAVDVHTRNGDLYISDRDSDGVTWTIMGYSHEDYRITIEAPYEVSLDIRGDDDDYRIRSVHGAINMRVDDGDIQLSDCRGNEFEFRVDDGDIQMDGGKGKLYADLEDGDLEISNATFREVTARVDDGNINIETSLNNVGNYRLSLDDGTVELYISKGGGAFDLSHDDSRVSVDPAFNLIDKSEYRSSYKLAGGDANIIIRADDGNIRLRSGNSN